MYSSITSIFPDNFPPDVRIDETIQCLWRDIAHEGIVTAPYFNIPALVSRYFPFIVARVTDHPDVKTIYV